MECHRTPKTQSERYLEWLHGCSSECPGQIVHLRFDAGTVRNDIDEKYVDVAVKGSPLGPAQVDMPWTTLTAGHHCLQVELKWIGDSYPRNNLRDFHVPVAQYIAARSQVCASANSYAIPPKPPCSMSRARRPCDQYPYAHGQSSLACCRNARLISFSARKRRSRATARPNIFPTRSAAMNP
jgi:hypothetical protein